MAKYLKSVSFVFGLIGIFCSLFIIIFAVCSRHVNEMAYIGIGVVLLLVNVNNFMRYFKKQRKEESASAKLKFKGE